MIANEVSVNLKSKDFPIMSEECIIYRSLKHQKRLKTKVRTELSVDARMLKTLTSLLRS